MKFLKFATQAECITAFEPYLNADHEGNLHMPSYIGTSAVDVVGVIHKPTGTMLTNDEGLTYPETAPLDGWHVNMSGDCPPDLDAFVITPPATPIRVFA